jgi:hypothetical protein
MRLKGVVAQTHNGVARERLPGPDGEGVDGAAQPESGESWDSGLLT